VSQNASKHGIRSLKPVVAAFETEGSWKQHREAIMSSLSPEGGLEEVLCDRVALCSWRLNRVTAFETGCITSGLETIEDEMHERERFVSVHSRDGYVSTHPADIRSEAAHYEQNHSALSRFPSLSDEKTMQGEDATAVVWDVLMAAEKAVEGEIHVESLDLPGVPDDAFIEELPDMKAADVRGCVEAVAAYASLDPDWLLQATTNEAGYQARSAAHKREQVEQEITRKARERILPDAKELQKISRYEAHLSRELYKALHELQALQALRAGGSAPLGRLDVT
jgi:hypothetical protein